MQITSLPSVHPCPLIMCPFFPPSVFIGEEGGGTVMVSTYCSFFLLEVMMAIDFSCFASLRVTVLYHKFYKLVFLKIALWFVHEPTGFFVTILIAAVMFKSNDIVKKQTALKVM